MKNIFCVAPTCKEKGTEKRTCSCGEIETNELEIIGHTFGALEVTLAPTTARDGVETRFCADCRKAERRVVSKLSGGEPPVTAEPTPDATPTVTPDNTADNTVVPDTGVPSTGTNVNTDVPTNVGNDGDSVFSGDFVGIAILLTLLVVLAIVVYATIKIFIKA